MNDPADAPKPISAAPLSIDAQFQALLEASRSKVERSGAPRRGHRLFRHLFVPVMLLALLATWSLGGVFPAGATTGALLLWLALVWLAEQVYPARAEWNPHLLSGGAPGWRRFGRDLFYLLYVTFGTALLIQAIAPRFTSALGAAHLQLGLWPARAPLAVKIALAFLAVELLSYGLHRAAHHFRILWQFHSTHHVVTELGGLKAVRTHPVDDVLFHLARNVPLILVGAGAQELVAVAFLCGALGILAHANLDLSEAWLGGVFNLPATHAVHHAADARLSHANFGCHTVIWDRVFGTLRRAHGATLEIGVDPVGPRSLWQELAWPFYRSVTLPAAAVDPGDPP